MRMLLLPSTLLLLTPWCSAQPPAKYSATVALKVRGGEGDGDMLENQVKSFFGRELRSLGDVSIVTDDDDPDYAIRVNVFKTKTIGGSTIGYSLATSITRAERAEIITDPIFGLKQKLEDWQMRALKMWMAQDVKVIMFDLRAGSMDDVQSTCQEIIADFDAHTLNEQRAAWNKAHKIPAKPN